MGSIFVSYSHDDKAAARRIVDALARESLDAWWDHEIPPGRSWDEVIGQRIATAHVVIVIWSKKSVASNFVKEEAQLAYEANKLLPVKVEDVEPPVGFRRLHAANLVGWRGEAEHRQWQTLLDEIRPRLGSKAAPELAAQRQAKPQRRKSNVAAIAVGALALFSAIGGGTWYFAQSQPASANGQTAENRVQTTSTGPAAAIDPTASAAPASTVPPAPASANIMSIDDRAIEFQFWKSCCDRAGATVEDYRIYLSRYSKGDFAEIAQTRLSSMSRASAPTSQSANLTQVGNVSTSPAQLSEHPSLCVSYQREWAIRSQGSIEGMTEFVEDPTLKKLCPKTHSDALLRIATEKVRKQEADKEKAKLDLVVGSSASKTQVDDAKRKLAELENSVLADRKARETAEATAADERRKRMELEAKVSGAAPNQ